MDRDRDRRVATDGSGHVCEECGETFETLTRLRLHEKDDCPERRTYAEIDLDAGDVGGQAASELAVCRGCDRPTPNASFDVHTSFDGDDYHYIVEFACRHCGFGNENRVVMTGVDPDDLDRLPPHLQPDDLEPMTDGGSVRDVDPDASEEATQHSRALGFGGFPDAFKFVFRRFL